MAKPGKKYTDIAKKLPEGPVSLEEAVAFIKANPPEDKDAFRKAWLAARADSLKKAGLDVIFD